MDKQQLKDRLEMLEDAIMAFLSDGEFSEYIENKEEAIEYMRQHFSESHANWDMDGVNEVLDSVK